jgi:hypothetical protein
MRCSGDSPKEVTLCHIADCHLWPYRFGFSINDKRFKKRMASARREYPAEFGEMLELVSEYLADMPNSLEKAQIRAFFEENSGSE